SASCTSVLYAAIGITIGSVAPWALQPEHQGRCTLLDDVGDTPFTNCKPGRSLAYCTKFEACRV
ncbi:hypothetical protein, partial [Rhodococcus zopfii]|uniref:hypothetical protein n=1 Tax=Rhodococcus zopfii TaxID=43772 RepID=UPI000AD18612